MDWETERYDWSELRAAGTAEGVPTAVRALTHAESDDDAERFYWQLDNTVIVQGALYESALPTVRLLLDSLQQCTAVARPWILELLVQIGSGEAAPTELEIGNDDLPASCARELFHGSALFFRILEGGSAEERASCVDLLGMCAEMEPALQNRFAWYLKKLRNEPLERGHRELVERWLAALGNLTLP